MPGIAALLSNGSVTFTVPDSDIQTIDSSGTIDLRVDGNYLASVSTFQVRNNGSDIQGFVAAGAVVTIGAESYTVKDKSRTSRGKLTINLVSPLSVGLSDGDGVVLSTANIVVDSLVPLSRASFPPNIDGSDILYGFQIASVDISTVPATGWVADWTDQAGKSTIGSVIDVDDTGAVILVWVGKKGSGTT
jgi:hypothetical protein